MGFSAQVKIGGKLAKLKAIVSGQSASGMAPVMQRMLKLYSIFTVQRFDTMAAGGSGPEPQTGQSEGPWAPLSDKTLGGHKKVKHLLLILVRSGLMRQMVRSGFTEVSGVSKIGNGRFEISAHYSPLQYENGLSTLDVMGFHQEGTDRMPQRIVLAQPGGRAMQHIAEEGKKALLAQL